MRPLFDFVRSRSFPGVLAALCLATLPVSAGTATERLYLSGRDKDDSVRWDFFCSAGRNSGFWTNILVPSNWELQGFGAYDYGHTPRSRRSTEQGKYRHSFEVPAGWIGKRIFLVFEGSMTDTEVLVNGRSAGPIHQGGFYRFKYEVTELARPGTSNLLEVTVSKVSADANVEDAERIADYWIFGGIYRPVYLEALPPAFIDWTAVDAKADGRFLLDVHLQGVPAGTAVKAQVLDRRNQAVGAPMTMRVQAGAEDKVTLTSRFKDVQLWSAETPNLYYVLTTLEKDGQELHRLSTRFGFRTLEVRAGKGLFLNGQRIFLQGANRHSFWPDSGRCLSRQVCFDDARLMKSMNMNAVRMSHYPPDIDFLEACDELGLYVLDELAGWQKQPYTTPVGKRLVRQMLMRDVNHPSILFWDNGNEGGWNTELDSEFWLYDPQRRTVLHPWESSQGVNTAHYRPFDEHQALLEGRLPAVARHKYVAGDIYLPTEFLHGLYDGGHGAGLLDYWNAMRASHFGGGGFLWALVDEGVLRTDKGGILDCAGNLAPDGIVGPHREKEGSFFTIKELWSPVQVLVTNLPSRFSGVLEIENRYAFLNLNQCTFRWEIVDFRSPWDSEPGHIVRHAGVVAGPDIQPGKRGKLALPLPKKNRGDDALRLTAYDPSGADLWTWTWPLKSPAELVEPWLASPRGEYVVSQVKGNTLEITTGLLSVQFDLSSGLLSGARWAGTSFSLSNGPRLAPVPQTNTPAVVHHASGKGGSYTLNASQGPLRWRWTVQPSGVLDLECSYDLNGSFPFHGVTFDYPERLMREKTWLGGGPYRVWKNRLQGTALDVWRTAWNDPNPGEQWDYPEFKGYFRDVAWVNLLTAEGQLAVFNATPGLFLRVGTPQWGRDPKDAVTPFPAGQLSFLHAIPAIGNKFQSPATLGPSSQLNAAKGTYQINLRFLFGTPNTIN